MVVFDTSVLALAFDAGYGSPIDPATKLELTNCQERINNLIDGLSKKKVRILIPTPALAEYLVRGGADKDKRVAEFTSSRAFTIAPFDLRAAIECALLEDGDSSKPPKTLDENETRAKVKYDRQIIAIAKTQGVDMIYTGDNKLAECAMRNGIPTKMTWEIPEPESAAQGKLDLAMETEPAEKGSW